MLHVTVTPTGRPAANNLRAATPHLHHAAHEVVQARVQVVHFTRRQHAVDHNKAVALQRLPLLLGEIEG